MKMNSAQKRHIYDADVIADIQGGSNIPERLDYIEIKLDIKIYVRLITNYFSTFITLS